MTRNTSDDDDERRRREMIYEAYLEAVTGSEEEAIRKFWPMAYGEAGGAGLHRDAALLKARSDGTIKRLCREIAAERVASRFGVIVDEVWQIVRESRRTPGGKGRSC